MSWFKKSSSDVKESSNSSKTVVPMATRAEHGAPLAGPIGSGDFTWQQLSTESQTFYIHLDSGAFIFAQVAYSSIALSPSSHVTIRYFPPDGAEAGQQKHLALNLSGGGFKLSPDKRSVTVEAPTATLQLVRTDNEGRPLEYRLAVDHPELILSMAFVVADGCPLPTKLKSGRSEYPHGDFLLHHFAPVGTVVGEFGFLPDGAAKKNASPPVKSPFAGTALFVHAGQSTKPHLMASRWAFLSAQDTKSKSAFVVVQYEPPKNLSPEPVTQAILTLNGQLIALSMDTTVTAINPSTDSSTGYAIPKAVSITCRGKTVADNQDVTVDVGIELNEWSSRLDILAELPFLLRKVVQALITKPFAYMWTKKVAVKVNIGGKESTIDGNAYYECTLLSSD